MHSEGGRAAAVNVSGSRGKKCGILGAVDDASDDVIHELQR